MNKADLVEQLKRHEGCVLYAYEDHLGYLTIGYGRLIDDRRGGRISEAEASLLLFNDIDRVTDAIKNKLPRFHKHPDIVQNALINMGFQLGVTGLMGFENMLAAIDRRDYEAAADEALDSLWASPSQTPERAKEIAEMIRSAGDST